MCCVAVRSIHFVLGVSFTSSTGQERPGVTVSFRALTEVAKKLIAMLLWQFLGHRMDARFE